MIRLALHALENPRAWLAALGVATVVVGAGVGRLELRTDGDVLRPAGDLAVAATTRDAVRFQDPRQVLLLVRERAEGPELESPEGFRFLARTHQALRATWSVRAESLSSLASLPRLERDGGGFTVGTYLEQVPDPGPGFDALLARLRARPLTDGLLLSPDGSLAVLYVPLTEQVPIGEALLDVQDTVEEIGEDAPFELLLAGPVVAETTLGRMVLRDLALFVPVMVLLIAGLLFVTLGDRAGVMVPLVEALAVLLWTLGAMGWLGIPVTLVTTVLPVVLMAMAITDEIHLLERIKAHRAGRSLREATRLALGEVATPIVATSVTTSLGFLSFATSAIEPLRHFGLFTALGITLAMLFSFTGIPALLALVPDAWVVPGSRETRGGRFDGLARWACAKPTAALLAGAAVLLVAVPGITKLRVGDSWVENFASDSPLVRAERLFNDAFWGSYRFDVVLEGPPEFFYAPGAAELMARARDVALQAPHVGGVLTHLTPLAEVARALGVGETLAALSPSALADVVTVAEMSPSRVALRELLSDRGNAARVRLFVEDASYERALAIQEHLEARLPDLLGPREVTWHYSGDLPSALAVVQSIVDGQLRSIAWTLVAIAGALALVFAPGRPGLAATLPVTAAAAALLGAMGWLEMTLGIATSMFASLTVGVGVDFGIHYVHRYRLERARGQGPGPALQATVSTVGRALRWNAGVLGLGFTVLAFSSLRPNRELGLLLAAAMGACYLATVLLLPRLLRGVPGAAKLAVLLVAFAAASPAARAQGPGVRGAGPCGARPAAEARALMAGLDARFRGEPRIVRMDIRTRYPETHRMHALLADAPLTKILWGVFDGDAQRTRVLYVFSGPGRLAGTTLLIHDAATSVEDDAMWLYLRSLGTFTALERGARTVLVPGTVLTYEDARGFIPVDSYHFSWAPARHDGGPPRVGACPRDRKIRADLGYAWLVIDVDREHDVVTHVEYADLGGKPLKTWEQIESVEVAGQMHPAHVRMRHAVEGHVTDVRYEHWPVASPPAPEIFRPELAESSFLERLRGVVEAAGLGERIGEELERADAVVREYDERMRQYDAKP